MAGRHAVVEVNGYMPWFNIKTLLSTITSKVSGRWRALSMACWWPSLNNMWARRCCGTAVLSLQWSNMYVACIRLYHWRLVVTTLCDVGFLFLFHP